MLRNKKTLKVKLLTGIFEEVIFIKGLDQKLLISTVDREVKGLLLSNKEPAQQLFEYLTELDYQLIFKRAKDIAEAAKLCQEINFDLILIFADVFSRKEVFQFLEDFISQKADAQLPPIIFIATNISQADKLNIFQSGVDLVLERPIFAPEFIVLVKKQLEHYFMLQEMAHLEDVLHSLVISLEARDKYTAGHSRRVAELAKQIGELYGLTDFRLNYLFNAALIHDIGKIGIPDQVLNKSGQLSDREYEIIQKHSRIGFYILKNMSLSQVILEAILHHHERWDGDGYPEGLAGVEISEEARILAIADTLDAMLSTRPYRDKMPATKAEKILKENRGPQWDPELIDIVLENNLVYRIDEICEEIHPYFQSGEFIDPQNLEKILAGELKI